MPKEIYVIAVLAIVLTALVVAGGTPDDIARALDSGLGGYRLQTPTPSEGVSH